MTLSIRRMAAADVDAWLALRLALWPDGKADAHRAEIAETLAHTRRLAAFGAWQDAALAGFVELSLRDYVDGAEERPCGFLEGLYVAPAHRRQGLATALVAAGEAWLAGLGVHTIGSDALIGNAPSLRLHAKLGFEQVERVVRFVKPAGAPRR